MELLRSVSFEFSSYTRSEIRQLTDNSMNLRHTLLISKPTSLDSFSTQEKVLQEMAKLLTFINRKIGDLFRS